MGADIEKAEQNPNRFSRTNFDILCLVSRAWLHEVKFTLQCKLYKLSFYVFRICAFSLKMADSRTQMYPVETMYQIGVGNEEECHFDFSFIPFSQYTKFFNTLPNFIYKKCKNIKFSCDFEYEYSQKKKVSGKTNRKRENLISDSIAGSRPKFLPYLMKILSRVLPKSKNLVTLQLSNLNIDPDNFDSVIDSIGKCRTLRNLEFTDIPFTDKHCIKLLKLISPYQYEVLCFNDCLLTSGSYRAFEEFLYRPPTNSIQERSIRKIELAGCTMNEVELDNIDYLLYGPGEEEEEEEEEEVDQTVPTTVVNTEEKTYDDYYEEEEDDNDLIEPAENIKVEKEDSYEYEEEQPQPKPKQPDQDEYEEEDEYVESPKRDEAPKNDAKADDDYEYEEDEEEEEPQQPKQAPIQNQPQDDEYEYEEEEDLPAPAAKPKPAPSAEVDEEEEDYYYDEEVQDGLPQNIRPQPQQKAEEDEYEYEYDDPAPPAKPEGGQPPDDGEYEYEYTDEM